MNRPQHATRESTPARAGRVSCLDRPGGGLTRVWPLPALLAALALGAPPAPAQEPQANYDEAKVPHYPLPDPLLLAGGGRVSDVESWNSKRRPEILKLFESHVYGQAPGRPPGLSFEVTRVVKDAL